VDYYAWISRHTRRAQPEDTAETEALASPSKPIDVQEYHASTTVIARIRDAIARRFRDRADP
jgi:hypothetical protein